MNEFLITLAGIGTTIGFLSGLFIGLHVGRDGGLGAPVRTQPGANAELTVDLSMRCACGRTVTVPAGFQISTGSRPEGQP